MLVLTMSCARKYILLQRTNTNYNRIPKEKPTSLFSNLHLAYPLIYTQIQKLKHLNVAVNRLWELPRGFGACPMLQVLDITYNNLTELPNNFHYLNTLRFVFNTSTISILYGSFLTLPLSQY